MRQHGQTLVATLIVIAIIAILAVYFLGRGGGDGSKGQSVIGTSRMDALAAQCKSNLQQLRASIAMSSSMGSDGYPETLAETKLPKDMMSCPAGHEAYIYDPKTGKVQCPHPGHENF